LRQVVTMSSEAPDLNDFVLARRHPFLYARKFDYVLGLHLLEALQYWYSFFGVHYAALLLAAVAIVALGYRRPAQCQLFADGAAGGFMATQVGTNALAPAPTPCSLLPSAADAGPAASWRRRLASTRSPPRPYALQPAALRSSRWSGGFVPSRECGP
jgi:hypothetical protein